MEQSAPPSQGRLENSRINDEHLSDLTTIVKKRRSDDQTTSTLVQQIRIEGTDQTTPLNTRRRKTTDIEISPVLKRIPRRGERSIKRSQASFYLFGENLLIIDSATAKYENATGID